MAQAHHRPADGLLDAAVDRGLRGRDPRHLLGSVKAKTHIVGQGDSPLELLRGLLLDLVKQGEQGYFRRFSSANSGPVLGELVRSSPAGLAIGADGTIVGC